MSVEATSGLLTDYFDTSQGLLREYEKNPTAEAAYAWLTRPDGPPIDSLMARAQAGLAICYIQIHNMTPYDALTAAMLPSVGRSNYDLVKGTVDRLTAQYPGWRFSTDKGD